MIERKNNSSDEPQVLPKCANLSENSILSEYMLCFYEQLSKGSQKHRERVTQKKEMAETVEEITIDWTDENGQQLVRQIKKEILTSGAWSTIMFLYQDFDKKAGDWGPKKIRVVRYQKRGGKYIPQSKFNVSSAKQARQIIESLQNWLPEMNNQGSSEDFNSNSNVKP